MKHTLYIEIHPETIIGIRHLPNEGLHRIFTALREVGVGTAEEERLSKPASFGWSLFARLAPLGTGEVLVTVQDETPPHWVLYTLRDDVLTEHDAPAILREVGHQLTDEYRVRCDVSVNEADDLANRKPLT